MTPKLILHRPPFRFDWFPAHPNCRSEGQVLGVKKSPDLPALLVAVIGRYDRECLKEIRRRTPRVGKHFMLSLACPWGKQPARFEVNRRRVDIPVGFYLAINPRTIAEHDAAREFNGVRIGLSQDLVRTCRELLGLPRSWGPLDFDSQPRPLTKTLNTILKTLLEKSRRPPEAAQDASLALELYAMGQQIFGTLWATHPSGLRDRMAKRFGGAMIEGPIQLATAYLRDHLVKPVDQSAVARNVGLSRASYFRAFAREVGCSPQSYLRRLRVEQAETLKMQHPQWSVNRLALEVGYQSAKALREAIRAVHWESAHSV